MKRSKGMLTIKEGKGCYSGQPINQDLPMEIFHKTDYQTI